MLLEYVASTNSCYLIHSSRNETAVSEIAEKIGVFNDRLISFDDANRLEELAKRNDQPLLIFDDFYRIIDEAINRQIIEIEKKSCDIFYELLKGTKAFVLQLPPIAGIILAEQMTPLLRIFGSVSRGYFHKIPVRQLLILRIPLPRITPSSMLSSKPVFPSSHGCWNILLETLPLKR